MKAITYHRYGSPSLMKLEELPIPVPKENEVLIRVCAASVNSWDWDLVRGRPLLVRLGGLRKPRFPVLGADIAGRVEAAGEKVTGFKPGDEVLGDISGAGWGGFAEYVSVKSTVLAKKPAEMSFEEAASLPQAGVIALQGMRSKRPPGPGSKILINGAGGGVGSFALQIARNMQAEVTGVDSAEKFELMRACGADHCIDYRTQNFTRTGEQYDLILDITAHHPLGDCRRALRPGGRYVMAGGDMKRIFGAMVRGSLLSLLGSKKSVLLLHRPSPQDINILLDMYRAGKLKPVIDKVYPLQETPAAIQYLGDGHAKGKIIIKI